MITTMLNEPMFDGVGPLIHKILHKGWKTSMQNRVSYEDYFQDFVVLWLKRRSKFDPSRGMMTTFAGTVALNYVRGQIKKSKHPKNHGYGQEDNFDISAPHVEFDNEELRLIETYQRLDNKKAIGLVKRLCQATNMEKKQVLEAMDSIKTKVKQRSEPTIIMMI